MYNRNLKAYKTTSLDAEMAVAEMALPMAPAIGVAAAARFSIIIILRSRTRPFSAAVSCTLPILSAPSQFLRRRSPGPALRQTRNACPVTTPCDKLYLTWLQMPGPIRWLGAGFRYCYRQS